MTMTLSEFKAWLDGYGEAIGDAPTPEQWAKIKAKIAETEAIRLSARPAYAGIPTVWPAGYPNSGTLPAARPYTTCVANGANQTAQRSFCEKLDA